MKWTGLVVIAFFTITGCTRKITDRIPPCIQEKIDAIANGQRYNPPATVYRYNYMGKKVYLFSADCCDQFNYLYDKDCNVICAPSGGFTGKGDGSCKNFKEMATDETLIWQDKR